MIDLHSHILPALDDGAPDLGVALEMARIAVDDGVTHMACTPHVFPGVYANDADDIVRAVTHFRNELAERGISLQLIVGADVHVVPDLPQQLKSRRIPTLNDSRYFLFEPPHHVLPPRIENLVSRLLDEGYVPIITHPERMTWLESHYSDLIRFCENGCMLQVTAGALVGDFGRAARYFAEKLVGEGYVDIVASDAHGIEKRRPGLSKARQALANLVGEKEADDLVLVRPAAIMADEPMATAVSQAPCKSRVAGKSRETGLRRLKRFLQGSSVQ